MNYAFLLIMNASVLLVVFLIAIIETFNINDAAKDNDRTIDVIVSLSDVKFVLFTEKYQTNGINLNESTYTNVAIDKLTILIIHGWLQNSREPWIDLMKDAYLNKSSFNIITLDWSKFSENVYSIAVHAVPKVGLIAGDLIYNLTKIGIDVNKIKINGFSMGAHIAGAAGQRVFSLFGSKIYQINGLDAANQEFSGKPIDQRLDSSDAIFVQGIHTNRNGFGIPENYGIIDFLVNYYFSVCGSKQIGCPEHPGVPSSVILSLVACHHIRAAAYFIESINSDKFLGVECGSCTDFGQGLCNSNSKTIMGEMCPSDQSGVRYLNTNSDAPFAQQ